MCCGACDVNMFEVSAGEVASGACVVNMFEVSAGEVASGACVVEHVMLICLR